MVRSAPVPSSIPDDDGPPETIIGPLWATAGQGPGGSEYGRPGCTSALTARAGSASPAAPGSSSRLAPRPAPGPPLPAAAAPRGPRRSSNRESAPARPARGPPRPGGAELLLAPGVASPP